jgi:hypothetical protein
VLAVEVGRAGPGRDPRLDGEVSVPVLDAERADDEVVVRTAKSLEPLEEHRALGGLRRPLLIAHREHAGVERA